MEKTLSPYDSDEEMNDEDDDNDDWFSDDEEFAEPAYLDAKVKRSKSKTIADGCIQLFFFSQMTRSYPILQSSFHLEASNQSGKVTQQEATQY